MQLPIAYAVLGKVEEQILKPIDLIKVGSLEFREITAERYPLWEMKDELLNSPKRGVIVNAANEAAIAQFIEGKISFLDISKRIIHAFHHFDSIPSSIDEVFEIDKEVRRYIGML